MTTKKAAKSHIKMYASDEFIKAVKEAAEKEDLSQSAFILIALKNKIKRTK